MPLKLTLKELYTGTVKRLKITRRVPDPSDPQKLTTKEEILEIQVKPGWKEGTRITFQGKGDELPGRPAQVSLESIHSLHCDSSVWTI